MSSMEVAGIAANVLQLKDVGARLSVKLFTLSRKTNNAKTRISRVAQEVALTGAALYELGDLLEDNGIAEMRSHDAIAPAKQVIADCWYVFDSIAKTMDVTVLKDRDRRELNIEMSSSFSFHRGLKFPFTEPDLLLLKAKLESLKCSLILLLQNFSVAAQFKRQSSYIVPEEQKTLFKTLSDERTIHERTFSRMMQRLRMSSGNNGTEDESDTDAIPASRPLSTTSQNSASIRSSVEFGSGDDELPERISNHKLEIRHHARLTHSLVKEVGQGRYKVSHGVRHGMESAVLKAHFDEWSQLSRKYGFRKVLRCFQDESRPVTHYWIDQYDTESEHDASDRGQRRRDRDENGRHSNRAEAQHVAEPDFSTGRDQVPLNQMPPSHDAFESKVMPEEQQDTELRPVHLKDAIGRTYQIPYAVAGQWIRLRPLLTKAFAQIEDIGDMVAAERYDMTDEVGNIIMPDLCDTLVKPGMSVTMLLWPLPDELSKKYERPAAHEDHPQQAVAPGPVQVPVDSTDGATEDVVGRISELNKYKNKVRKFGSRMMCMDKERPDP